MWGCDNLSQGLSKGKWVEHPHTTIEYGDAMYAFYRHPDLYLLPYVGTFITEHNHNKEYNISIPYAEIGAKEAEMINIYENAFVYGKQLKDKMNGNKH